jgi:hypothetical protein
MSVSEVSSNTNTLVEDNENAQNREKYNEYYKQYTDLVDSEGYKSYFGANGELKKLKDILKAKLDALDEAITNTYDEKVIDELMESLGALLSVSKNNVEIYKELLKVKGEISDADYNTLLGKLNSENGITEDDFDGFKDVAVKRQSYIKFLDNYKTNGYAGETKTLEDALKTSLDAIGDSKAYITKLSELSMSLENAASRSILSASKTKGITRNGSLSLLVAKSDNAYKELESELKSTEKLDNESKVDEKLRRLRDEGIWADSSLNRREQMLQEEEARESRKKND